MQIKITNRQHDMYKLSYHVNNRCLESWFLPNKALCNWKKKQLKATHKLGIFKIEQV